MRGVTAGPARRGGPPRNARHGTEWMLKPSGEPDEADPAGSVARLRDAMAPGSYLLISHADVSPAHAVGTRRLSEAARELEEADHALATVPARTRDEIVGFSAT